MLTAGGAHALDQLLPGTTDLLFAAYAYKLAMGRNILTLSSEGWFRRVDDDAFFIACSRNLLDHVVRQQALTNPAITVLQETKATGLVGTASRVTGVRYEKGTEPEQTLTADLVVDATGSRSKTPQWLTDLGVAELYEEFLDAGLAYAGRLYEAPADAAADFPGVLIQTVPNTEQARCRCGLHAAGERPLDRLPDRHRRPAADRRGRLHGVRPQRGPPDRRRPDGPGHPDR